MSDLYGGVTVHIYPFGVTDYSMATAEHLADDSLVVYRTEDGSIWRRYPPDQWFTATVTARSLDEVLHYFVNRTPPERTSVRPPRS